MEILELELKHFGKFTDHKVSLQPGINIIYGSNESGKSTIHAFIRAMLFGFGSTRGRNSRVDEYHLRQPRENPGYFAGNMRIRENGEIWLIERNFERHNRSLRIWNETRKEEAADPEQVLQTLLGGLGEAVYGNTMFVRQAHMETDEELMEELKRFTVNVDTAADQNTDVSAALQSLRKRRKKAEQKRREEENRIGAQIGNRQEQADELKQQLEELRARERTLSQPPGREIPVSGSRYADRRQTTFEPEEHVASGGRYRLILEILLGLASLLCLLGAVGLRTFSIRVFLGVFSGIFLLCIIPVHLLMDSQEEEDGTEDTGGADTASGDTAWKLSVLRQDISGKESEFRKLNGELEVLYQSDENLKTVTTEIDALTLAMDRISELSATIFHESGSQLRHRASEILSDLTYGRYSRLTFDEQMEIRVLEDSHWLYLYELSFGTMQQIYFALRMAAGEALASGKNLPLVLDEPFAMYDDDRLRCSLSWLSRCGRQVILFTCQKREREIMQEAR